MPDTTWEDRIRDDWQMSRTDPADLFTRPLQADEMQVAQELMGHMRYMTTNWIPPTKATTKLLTKDKHGDWPEDARGVNCGRSIMWMTVKQCGDYWEVHYGSQEFSSSFSTMARGRTLSEALYNVAQEG